MRHMYPPEQAAQFFAPSAGQPYRPSSGTEGEMFEAVWCDGCAIRGICKIPIKAMAFDKGEPGYPKAWVYGEDGQPKCTAFRDASAPRRRPAPMRPGPDVMGDLFAGEALASLSAKAA